MTTFVPQPIVMRLQPRAPTLDDLSADFQSAAAAALTALLPPGRAWQWKNGGVGNRLFTGMGKELARLIVDLQRLRFEGTPTTTLEMIDEWEYAVGLPDPCMEIPAADIDARRAAVIARLAGVPTFTEARIVEIGADLGYTVTLVTIPPSRAGLARAGEELAGADVYAQLILIWAGSGTVPPALVCAVMAEKPAHNVVEFHNGTFRPRVIDVRAQVLNVHTLR